MNTVPKFHQTDDRRSSCVKWFYSVSVSCTGRLQQLYCARYMFVKEAGILSILFPWMNFPAHTHTQVSSWFTNRIRNRFRESRIKNLTREELNPKIIILSLFCKKQSCCKTVPAPFLLTKQRNCSVFSVLAMKANGLQYGFCAFTHAVSCGQVWPSSGSKTLPVQHLDRHTVPRRVTRSCWLHFPSYWSPSLSKRQSLKGWYACWWLGLSILELRSSGFNSAGICSI